MKKFLILFFFIIVNLSYGFESNSFYREGEFNIYTIGSMDVSPPPPPEPNFGEGGGSTAPGAPAVTISMYLPLLFFIALFLIFKLKTRINNN